jgi:hypothetical protein
MKKAIHNARLHLDREMAVDKPKIKKGGGDTDVVQ